MTKNNYEVRITLKDLAHIFITKLWVIILAAVLVGTGIWIYRDVTYKPEYVAEAKFYVLRQDTEQNSSGYVQNLNAALSTVNDCKLIVKTYSTFDEVISELYLDMSAEELMRHVTLSSSSDSRIVTVRAKASTPDKAKEIADSVTYHGIERINEVMNVEQASVMEYAKDPTSPSNSVFSIKILLAAFIASAVTYAIYVLIFLTNEKLTDPDEVSQFLGLSVLGIIPNEDGDKKHKKYGLKYKYFDRKYKYYKSYTSSMYQDKAKNDSEKTQGKKGDKEAEGGKQ